MLIIGTVTAHFTKTAAATITPVMHLGVGMKYTQGVMWLLMMVLISLFCLVTKCLLLACRQATGSFNIPVLCTATEALHASVTLTVAVQLRTNEELVRVILGPVETTTPLTLSVHV